MRKFQRQVLLPEVEKGNMRRESARDLGNPHNPLL